MALDQVYAVSVCVPDVIAHVYVTLSICLYEYNNTINLFFNRLHVHHIYQILIIGYVSFER